MLHRQLLSGLVHRVLHLIALHLLAAVLLLRLGDEMVHVVRLEVAETVVCPPGDDAVQLSVGYEGALETLRLGGVGWHEQHIAAAQQLLGAASVQDRSRVDLRGDGEGDSCGEVRLDEAGDNVYGRPLGGDDQVDARGAGELGQAAYLPLHLERRRHHQVGQLVDDYHPVRDLVGGARALVKRLDVAHANGGEAAVAAVHLVNDRL